MYLEQFTDKVLLLDKESICDINRIASLNTQKHFDWISIITDNLWLEAESNKLEELYLIEIRKLWLLHIQLIDSVRKYYKDMAFKKLERPREFHDLGLPAYMELTASSTPQDNSNINLDENQKKYWQYLELAQKIEIALMTSDIHFSEKLGVISNFENRINPNTKEAFVEAKIRDKFIIELKPKELSERIKEIETARIFIQKVLNPVYCDARSEYYDRLISLILSIPFPEVEIPELAIDNSLYVIPYNCTKDSLYTKIKHIKNTIYPSRIGKTHLATVFYESTKNFKDQRTLKFRTLMNKI